MTTASSSEKTSQRRLRIARAGTLVRAIILRVPATWSTLAVVVIVGVATGGIWAPFEADARFEDLAYGLPAFQDGKWWTVVTGTFLVGQPWGYLAILPLFIGMAYLEYRRGWKRTLFYFATGQLIAVLATAGLLWLVDQAPWEWPWAYVEASSLDVGPSGGLFACLAAALALLPSPWRLRGWLALIAFAGISTIYWGSIEDLEHFAAVAYVFAVDRSLRPQRATLREQRLLAFALTIVLGVLTILTQVIPTDGPFGQTSLDGPPDLYTLINVVVIVIVSRGLVRGRRWAWVVSVVVASLNTLAALVLVAIGLALGWALLANEGTASGLALASGLVWLVYLIYLLVVHRAFRARPRRPLGVSDNPSVDEVKKTLHAHGGGTLSWMSTWPRNEYLRTRAGIVVYQRHAGVALALADPLGPADGRDASIEEFIDVSESAGLVPAFFSANEQSRAATPPTWRSLVVADDTIVDLPGLQFTGKRWGTVRTALNRARREGMTFRMTTYAAETWGMRAQLHGISEMWVGDKGLPEMGFTLGTLAEAEAEEVRIALAISPAGDVDGFLSWLPVYGVDGAIDGWTLDLMRRREGGFGPVMEFLIGSSAELFASEDAKIMSLSGAPLAHEYTKDATALDLLADRLGKILEPVYGFASLHRFKEKFNPRYETMYLLYRDEADLPRIGLALTRAFLPDATTRQFAQAGLQLMGQR